MRSALFILRWLSMSYAAWKPSLRGSYCRIVSRDAIFGPMRGRVCRTWLFNQVQNICTKIVRRISYSYCCPIRISYVSMFESLWSKWNLLLTVSLLCNVLEFIELSLFAKMRRKRVRNNCNVSPKWALGNQE